MGTIYYYATVSFSSGGCGTITSNTARITVNPLPTISTQPTVLQSICVGGSVTAIDVAYTGGVGTATYQWFSNTNNSNTGGTPIAGATSSSYTPPATTFTTIGNYYYYAEVTLSGSGCGTSVSEVSQVQVVADPIISVSALATQTQCQDAPSDDLTVQVTGGLGTISYQWYSNTTNTSTGGTPIPGANNPTYTPSTAIVGTQFYYVVVTQDVSGCTVTSAV